MEHLINQTLLQQWPELARASQAHQRLGNVQERASRLQEIFPPSISITPVLKRKETQESVEAKRIKSIHDKLQANGITIVESKECDPPWSLGCLYR